MGTGKWFLFLRLWETKILIDHETGCVGKIIFLSFHAYKEHPNRMLCVSCVFIWTHGGPGLRIRNKYEKQIIMIWTNWKETRLLDIHMARKYTWLEDLSSMYYGRELSHVCVYTQELNLTFYGKEILHFCGYWKTILFLWFRATPILVDHETSCIGKIISLSFHA
jgi:hypothetical protein